MFKVGDWVRLKDNKKLKELPKCPLKITCLESSQFKDNNFQWLGFYMENSELSNIPNWGSDVFILVSRTKNFPEEKL